MPIAVVIKRSAALAVAAAALVAAITIAAPSASASQTMPASPAQQTRASGAQAAWTAPIPSLFGSGCGCPLWMMGYLGRPEVRHFAPRGSG